MSQLCQRFAAACDRNSLPLLLILPTSTPDYPYHYSRYTLLQTATPFQTYYFYPTTPNTPYGSPDTPYRYSPTLIPLWLPHYPTPWRCGCTAPYCVASDDATSCLRHFDSL